PDTRSPRPHRPPLGMADRPDDDWRERNHATTDLAPAPVRPAVLSTAGLVDGEPDAGGRVVFAHLEDRGQLTAIARGAVTSGPSGAPRVAVSCVQTADGHRRRGLAEIVTAALVEWGLGLGAQ